MEENMMNAGGLECWVSSCRCQAEWALACRTAAGLAGGRCQRRRRGHGGCGECVVGGGGGEAGGELVAVADGDLGFGGLQGGGEGVAGGVGGVGVDEVDAAVGVFGLGGADQSPERGAG